MRSHNKRRQVPVTLPYCLPCQIQVGVAFGKLEEGYESAIKDYYKKQIAQLNNLVSATWQRMFCPKISEQ